MYHGLQKGEKDDLVKYNLTLILGKIDKIIKYPFISTLKIIVFTRSAWICYEQIEIVEQGSYMGASLNSLNDLLPKFQEQL